MMTPIVALGIADHECATHDPYKGLSFGFVKKKKFKLLTIF